MNIMIGMVLSAAALLPSRSLCYCWIVTDLPGTTDLCVKQQMGQMIKVEISCMKDSLAEKKIVSVTMNRIMTKRKRIAKIGITMRVVETWRVRR